MSTSIDKQVEEMARAIYKNCDVSRECAKTVARVLTNKGYPKQSDWISVEDRLPTKAGKYLVYREAFACSITDMLYYDTNYMGHNDGMKNRAVWFSYDSEWGEYEIYGVTHWMPLPKAPKNSSPNSKRNTRRLENE